ncbi:hypothetical protein SAGO17_0066 [Mimivirus AB-566-O17]|uniref:Uncharacterized protein n=1 Tax=Mimivirus AB-566-O17 TaxID=1988039 RepID=A0A1X9VNS3_9VIRU|nr:hypothetical protein SAGO17_0066 [Mimivirus AB-566-O17]
MILLSRIRLLTVLFSSIMKWCLILICRRMWIRCCNLAEAPGGLFRVRMFFVKKKQKRKSVVGVDGFTSSVIVPGVEPEIYTMSLDRYHPKYLKYNLPSYNEQVLKKNVHVLYGKDNTGDISNIENFMFLKSYINKKLDFITADGGFDEGDDFNNKEALHYKLIFY